MQPRAIAVTLTVLLGACGSSKEQAEVPVEPNVVNVTARGLTLEAPTEISSGWNTFRFANRTEMVHFVLIERLPEGQGIESQQREVAPVFQDGFDLLASGDVDAALARFGELPAWFGEIVFIGGPGLTSAGQISEATVNLEPGTYLLECYVKTDGVFHSMNPDPEMYGMVHEFTVTETESEEPEPTASVHMSISSTDGIKIGQTPGVGAHTVRVTFEDQTGHENFVGHDVHLARVRAGADLSEFEAWMDWTQPGGLQTPGPVEFLGGLNEMPAGSTGYFSVVLEPGEYVWIAEVPGSSAKGMLQRFTVSR